MFFTCVELNSLNQPISSSYSFFELNQSAYYVIHTYILCVELNRLNCCSFSLFLLTESPYLICWIDLLIKLTSLLCYILCVETNQLNCCPFFYFFLPNQPTVSVEPAYFVMLYILCCTEPVLYYIFCVELNFFSLKSLLFPSFVTFFCSNEASLRAWCTFPSTLRRSFFPIRCSISSPFNHNNNPSITTFISSQQ